MTGLRAALLISVLSSTAAVGFLANAQVQKGSKPESTGEATDQKLPANSEAHEVTPEELRKFDIEASATAEVKAGPIIHAPLLGIQAIDPAKLSVLQQQKLAVSEMKLHSTVPVAHLPPQTGAASMARPALKPSTTSGIEPAASATLAKPMLLATGPGSSPNTLMSAQGTNNGSPTTLAGTTSVAIAAPHKTNLAASTDTANKVVFVCQSPLISDVNHQTKNAVFTPELEYNSYVIKGCFFGTQPGKIYLAGKFNAQQVNLQPEFWSDTEIDARVDPKTSGEQDQQNVTLIVAPAGAGEIKATGFDFVAARSDPAVFLPSIPQSWFNGSGWSGAWVDPTTNFESPVVPGSNAPKSLSGYSVYVWRANNKKFSPGTDKYNPQLAPGWTLDSVQMSTLSAPPGCIGVVTYKQTFGTPVAYTFPMTPDWTKLQRNGVRVDGSDTSCSGYIPPFATYSNSTGSAYALKIWAKGPRCTDPVSGLPQNQCMQHMQQCGTETCSN